MKTRLLTTVLFSTVLLFLSCGEGTDVVESGTYQGTIKEVEPSKSEIYVETEDDKTLELYFTEDTELTRNGSPADFSVLEEGMRVEVDVEKEGQRLNPLAVRVLE